MFTDKALRKQVSLEICGVYKPFAIIFIIFTHFLIHMEFIAARFPFLELLAIFWAVPGSKNQLNMWEILKIRKFLLGNEIFLIQKLIAILKQI